jgi:hypothetical protein
MFKQRIHRTNADLTNVVRINLKMLHKDFLTSAQYRQQLAEARTNASKNWICIENNQTILCGISSISENQSFTLHLSAKPQNNFEWKLPHSGTGKKYIVMYYIIDGKVKLEHEDTKTFHSSAYNSNCKGRMERKILKTGDANIQIMSGSTNSTYASSRTCQLLVVAVPADNRLQ